MASPYAVPGVYYEPRPRALPRPLARTDVVGFVGFEPRVRDGTKPTQLIGHPPAGHAFQVDVIGFQLPPELLGGVRASVPATTDLVLSESAVPPIPIPPGGAIKYALAAVLGNDGKVHLVVVAGPASTTEDAAAAMDEDIAAVAAEHAWVRLADVAVRRSSNGLEVFPAVLPALPPSRCDDWNDFALQLGGIPAIDDGSLLARSVRAYFANGGARCHVATIRRPRFDDTEGMKAALADLVGVAGASEAEATGLERLLRIFEVAIVDTPDLYARSVDPVSRSLDLPPLDVAACFRCCDDVLGVLGVNASGAHQVGGPLFDAAAVLDAQKAMLLRCAPERWRVLLLLAAPVELDPPTGVFRGPDANRSRAWRMQLDNVVDDLAASCGAFYHPWALTQEKIGAPIVELPPTGLAAGVLARRDIARGPHIAPANERLIGVVGLSPQVDDAINAAIYETPLNINPLRAFPGLGIQLWGARTLSADRWLRYLPVRRCLSAIERRALVALRPLVFEPITPTLWFQITQALLGILVPIFNAGALRGETQEQAFYVRCDDTNNPPETVAAGQVLCEVGVAIAAPAEFIVFRVGRREATIDIVE
jgi:Bacteriophage tail sheath protein